MSYRENNTYCRAVGMTPDVNVSADGLHAFLHHADAYAVAVGAGCMYAIVLNLEDAMKPVLTCGKAHPDDVAT